jgi:myo-inositol-1(or 4)-monophosphatase
LQHLVKSLSAHSVRELEQLAVHLAKLAGEYILCAPLDRSSIEFKNVSRSAPDNAGPVSNIDREVEAQLRAQIAEHHPDHVVIGEETEIETPERDDAPFVWVLDPLDGTTNYLNGLPLFACSIALLYRHVPVVGAIWCASTHACRPGIYHAHQDGPLCFDGAPLARRTSAQWRGLASEPGDYARYAAFFETRVLASSALECAYVAAGVLRIAYLSAPAIWDVAAGVVLASSAGCRVLTQRDGRWREFSAFTAAKARKRISTLRAWRQPVLIGEPYAIDREAAVATAID